MQSLQPITRKTNHIEGLRFHPADTQTALFDAIVNGMKIFQGVDEHGEKCEYMYILSDKQELYKMKMFSEEIYRDLEDELMCCDTTTIAGWIKQLKSMRYEFIETIPLLSASRFAYPLVDKYNTYYGNYYIFKCRKGRFSFVRGCLLGHRLKSFFPQNGEILVDIDNYLSFSDHILSRREFGFNYETGKDEEKNLGRITDEDIQQGNAILEKVISYLENKLEKESSV